jgi:hypothetical protein
MYMANYSASKIAGVETHFSWGGLAAQAASSWGGQQIGNNAGFDSWNRPEFAYGAFAQGLTSGAIAGKLNKQWNRGGKVDYAAIALDAFSNEIANSLVGAMQPKVAETAETDSDEYQYDPKYNIAANDGPLLASNDGLGISDVELLGGQFGVEFSDAQRAELLLEASELTSQFATDDYLLPEFLDVSAENGFGLSAADFDFGMPSIASLSDVLGTYTPTSLGVRQMTE